jgi:hypothetical protein
MNTHPHADHTGGLRRRPRAQSSSRREQRGVPGEITSTIQERCGPQTDPAETEEGQVEAAGEKVSGWNLHGRDVSHPRCTHSNGLIIAYIPKEKAPFLGDFSPPNPGEANDHIRPVLPWKTQPDFDRYINVHTSPPAVQSRTLKVGRDGGDADRI